MPPQEPTEAELQRAEQAWRDLQGLTSQRAIWELALLCRQREGHAFEHGVIEGRRYPTGQICNPYNGTLTQPYGALPRRDTGAGYTIDETDAHG